MSLDPRGNDITSSLTKLSYSALQGIHSLSDRGAAYLNQLAMDALLQSGGKRRPKVKIPRPQRSSLLQLRSQHSSNRANAGHDVSIHAPKHEQAACQYLPGWRNGQRLLLVVDDCSAASLTGDNYGGVIARGNLNSTTHVPEPASTCQGRSYDGIMREAGSNRMNIIPTHYLRLGDGSYGGWYT
jgi:hypothetical protein